MAEETGIDTHQYLTFTLSEEVFALDIATVREVLELTTITKIPRTPEFMRGVINLRGHAVPVVDMRVKFGMERAKDTVNTCIIIVEVNVDNESLIMGAVADSVREVFEMRPDQIDPPPKMGTSIDASFIRGMGKHEEGFIIILDINKIFSIDELTLVQSSSKGQESREPAEAAA